MTPEPPITTAETATRLGCDASHVRRLIIRGHLRAVRFGERALAIDPASVREYQATRRKPGPRPKAK